MVRYAALAVVLTLTVGAGAGSLCRAWCTPAAQAAAECQHSEPADASTVATEGSCSTPVLGVSLPVRDTVRREATLAVVNVGLSPGFPVPATDAAVPGIRTAGRSSPGSSGSLPVLRI